MTEFYTCTLLATSGPRTQPLRARTKAQWTKAQKLKPGGAKGWNGRATRMSTQKTNYTASAWRRHKAALPVSAAFAAGAGCSAAARS